MHEDSVLNMPFDGTGQNHPLNRTSNALQLINIIAVADPLNILLDNRSAIKLLGHVMGSRPDDLDSALIGLGIRLTTDEGWQERMMDIDDPVPVMLDE